MKQEVAHSSDAGHTRRRRRSRHHPARRKRRERMRQARRALLWTGIVVVLLAADAGYALFRVGTQLDKARDHLLAGVEAFRDEDLTRARSDLEEAHSLAASVANMRVHPGFSLGMFLPVVGGDMRTLDVLAKSAEGASEAALKILEATEDVAVSRDLTGAFYRQGRFRFDALDEARPYLGDASRAIARSAELLRDNVAPRFEPIEEALRTARERVWDAEEAIERARVLGAALPGLLGEDEPKEYLLMFQTPSEARGTGGLFGLYGVLRARNGSIEVDDVNPIRELMRPYPAENVDAPPWFVTRYERFESVRDSSQANLSAHFPTVAEVMLDLARSISDRRFDGVVAMDPVAMGQLFGEGSIAVEGLGATVTADNIEKVLLHDIYDIEDQEEQESYLRRLVDQFWNKVENEGLDPEGVAEAATSKHIKWFSSNEALQADLLAADLGDDFTDSGRNVQFVFHNNRGVNKIDYFLDRSIETEIELTGAGEALVSTTISLRNRAPSGPASNRLGPGFPQDEPGVNRMYLNTILPMDARVIGYEVDGEVRRPQFATEAGYPVAWDLVELDAGESSEVRLEYFLRDAFDPDDGIFEMTLYPHAAVRPDHLEVTVTSREGNRLSVLGVASGEGEVVFERDLDEAIDLDVMIGR